MRVLVWSELFWPYIGGPELLVTSHDYLQLPDEDSYEGIPVHRLPLRAALEDPD